jgi:DNA-binding transcriptional ArsR family regulator
MEIYETKVFQLQADVCKTLSSPNRLIIVHALREGEKSLGKLVSLLGVPQGTVSRNLAILRDRGIVLPRHKGNATYYRLASPKIGEACDLVRGFLEVSLVGNLSLLDCINTATHV